MLRRATMNATPLLARLLKALVEQKLEVVLIGNAAAAIHGAPVTTLDFDFMFREIPADPSPVFVPVLMRELENSPRGVSEGGA